MNPFGGSIISSESAWKAAYLVKKKNLTFRSSGILSHKTWAEKKIEPDMDHDHYQDQRDDISGLSCSLIYAEMSMIFRIFSLISWFRFPSVPPLFFRPRQRFPVGDGYEKLCDK